IDRYITACRRKAWGELRHRGLKPSENVRPPVHPLRADKRNLHTWQPVPGSPSGGLSAPQAAASARNVAMCSVMVRARSSHENSDSASSGTRSPRSMHLRIASANSSAEFATDRNPSISFAPLPAVETVGRPAAAYSYSLMLLPPWDFSSRTYGNMQISLDMTYAGYSS